MTPKIFRDADATETKGESASPDLSSFLNKSLDEAFQLGVDKAIAIVQSYKDAGYTFHCLGAIIEKLNELKKPN